MIELNHIFVYQDLGSDLSHQSQHWGTWMWLGLGHPVLMGCLEKPWWLCLIPGTLFSAECKQSMILKGIQLPHMTHVLLSPSGFMTGVKLPTTTRQHKQVNRCLIYPSLCTTVLTLCFPNISSTGGFVEKWNKRKKNKQQQAYLWNRPTGSPAWLRWQWHSEQHISSYSTYRVSSG